MLLTDVVHAVDAHAEGELTRVIVGGLPPSAPISMTAKRLELVVHPERPELSGVSFTTFTEPPRAGGDGCNATVINPGRPAVRPSISGRAWLTGTHRLGRDPRDPLGRGFGLADTWLSAGSQWPPAQPAGART